jgi:hypothetical protein
MGHWWLNLIYAPDFSAKEQTTQKLACRATMALRYFRLTEHGICAPCSCMAPANQQQATFHLILWKGNIRRDESLVHIRLCSKQHLERMHYDENKLICAVVCSMTKGTGGIHL